MKALHVVGMFLCVLAAVLILIFANEKRNAEAEELLTNVISSFNMIHKENSSDVPPDYDMLRQTFTEEYIANNSYITGDKPWRIGKESAGFDIYGCILNDITQVVQETEEELIVSVRYYSRSGSSTVTVYLLKEDTSWKIDRMKW